MTTQTKTTWQKVKLGDVADLNMGQSPRSEFYNNCGEGLPFFQGVKDFGERKPTETMYCSEPAKVVERGDVLISVRAPVGDINITEKKSCIGRGVAGIRAKDKNNEFIYYLLLNFKDYIRSYSGGTTYESINKDVLRDLEFMVPKSPATRKQIADVLSAYDDLIENNTKRIKILEQIAQAIYKEWFVSSINVDELPKGWKSLQVEKLVKRVSPGKLYDNKSAAEKGDVPILDQGKSGIIGYHNDSPGVEASISNPIIVFANHTCYQRLILFPFSAIQNVLPFYPSEENYRDILWLHHVTKDIIEFNDYKGHWPEFMQKKIVVSPVDLAEKFGNKIKPLVVLGYRLELQNQNLRQARDLLLPKLVTGEIEIKI